MKFNVNQLVRDKDFYISGMSYIGSPKSNTAMFVSKKVERLIPALNELSECLVFAENGIEISDAMAKKHAFVFSAKPQLSYAEFANHFAKERVKEESKFNYNLTEQGYYLNENAVIDKSCSIEPGCVIGPDVTIGKNAYIMAGTIIKHASIGDNFYANECSVIGANGFTMTETEDGDKLRIPTLGRVQIGDNVEIGAHDNISCGSAGDTIIEDNVKIDALVHIGHDVHLERNVEITAGGIIGGFVDMKENAYVGINAVIRNRVNIGENVFIGMGSVVTKSIDDGTVIGNPAKRKR